MKDRSGEAAAGAVTIFILAGGKSTRMGADKAFVEHEGRTLLARALELARSFTSNVQIVGSQRKFAAFAPVVEDIFENCGPLAGIHAALRASHTELNLMLAVDMPFVSTALLQYLVAQACAAPNSVVIVPHVQERLQPLCAVYRLEFADVAEAALRRGQLKIDRLFDQFRTRAIPQTELQAAGFSPDMFGNLNTPQDLESCKSRPSRPRSRLE